MDLLSRLKKMNVKSNEVSSIPEIQFLEKSDLCLTLNRGFSELYRAQPANPVKFLAKWLLKEAKAKELENKYKRDEDKKEKLRQRCYQQQKIKETKATQEIQKQKDFSGSREAFIEKINACQDFWLSFNDFCEELKNLVKATGVYLAIFDLKRKPVTEEDDEFGHIHPSNQKVVRYIAWCADHDFLKGKCLELNTGVTYNLFAPKTDSNNPEGNQGETTEPPKEPEKQPDNNAPKKPEEKKEEKLPFLEIEDVILEPKVKFFKEPRLGSYLAIDINYRTSLNYDSLQSAIKNYREFVEKKTQQDERYKEWKEKNDVILKQIEEEKEKRAKDEEEKKLLEEQNKSSENVQESQVEGEKKSETEKKVEGDSSPKADQGKPNPNEPVAEQEDVIKNLEKELVEWTEEQVQLEDFKSETQKLILCLDTLGQDRKFSEDEKDFIDKVAKTILTALENHEKTLLEKDRDLRIKFEEDEAKLKEMEDYTDEKYEANAKNATTEFFNTEEFKNQEITDETLKEIMGDEARIKYLVNLMVVKEPSDILYQFAEFEFVEYERIFQNLFYFAHEDPIMINEPDTNRLEWKRAKTLWKSIFSYIQHYEPRGPKPEEVKGIYKLNRIKDNLEGELKKRNEVEAYSTTLVLLVDVILGIIKLRYDDIVYRRNVTKTKMEEREKIIASNKEIEEERNKIIEAAKAAKEQKEAEEKKAAEEANAQANTEEKKEEAKPAEEEKKEQEPDELEEELKKFDEEHKITEVPPELEYDLDNDFDINFN